mmetsp:Transcript_3307/g.10132  ORF Transcript_3307/g.10132 Transcript_3307/m.10132 type:complete len:323 (-) Transcript_3307:133-1101(-)
MLSVAHEAAASDVAAAAASMQAAHNSKPVSRNASPASSTSAGGSSFSPVSSTMMCSSSERSPAASVSTRASESSPVAGGSKLEFDDLAPAYIKTAFFDSLASRVLSLSSVFEANDLIPAVGTPSTISVPPGFEKVLVEKPPGLEFVGSANSYVSMRTPGALPTLSTAPMMLAGRQQEARWAPVPALPRWPSSPLSSPMLGIMTSPATPPAAPAAAPAAPVLKLELSEALPEPTVGSPEIPTVGSITHRLGNCKPCAFLFTKGCTNGVECPFCHLCEAGARKRRQKERKDMKKEMQLWVEHQATAHGGMLDAYAAVGLSAGPR